MDGTERKNAFSKPFRRTDACICKCNNGYTFYFLESAFDLFSASADINDETGLTLLTAFVHHFNEMYLTSSFNQNNIQFLMHGLFL